MFAAALFDMDGTLIDSERVTTDAWLAAAAALGHPMDPERFAHVIGLNAQASTAYLIELLGSAEAFRAVAREASRRLHDDGPGVTYPLKAGAMELVTHLRARGVPCAVASSSRADEIRERLDRVGILHHFDAVAGGDEVPIGKPDPAVYHLASSRLGVDAARCLAFEDSANGARAALAAGAQVVLVPDLRPLADDLQARSLRVLASLADAMAHVPTWFPGAIAR